MRLPNFAGRHSCRQVRGDGRKNVAAMKCSAYRLQEIALARDVTDFWLFARKDHGQHAVIGCDEVLARHFGQQRPTSGADARVHHHDVNRLLRKIAVCLRDRNAPSGMS